MVQASKDLPKLVDELIFGVWGEKGNKGNKGNKWYRENFTQEGEQSSFRFILYTIPERDGSERKFAMLYLAPKYYNDEENDYDDRKVSIEKDFESKGIKIVEFPFYCTFTEEVIRYYFFKTLFDESKKIDESEKNNENEESLKKAMASEKYKDAYRDCYKKHCDATPGWHGSPERLHTFTNHGIDRFEKELKNFKNYQKNLKSCQNNIYNQIIHSIAVDYSIKDNLMKALKKTIVDKTNDGRWVKLVNSFEFNIKCPICREFKKNFNKNN